MNRYQPLFDDLNHSRRTRDWCKALENDLRQAYLDENNGNLKRWQDALDALPDLEARGVKFCEDAVSCSGEVGPTELTSLEAALKQLKPWRKGPFNLFGLYLDTEWRSNLKWNRIAPHLELQGQDILDVGCGNGYYGWKMLGAGARRVVGLDPYLLYLLQYQALSKYFGPAPNYVLPSPDTVIPPNLRLFDTVFSMGVLYHRKSPIEHLQLLAHALKLGGKVVLETLVIEGDDHQVLLPEDRYAQMKNVWFLPTCKLLERMMLRCGFQDVEVIDVTPTTPAEQRATEWMTFESLENFLHPDDPSRTVEGYPGPLRATLRGVKS